MKKTIISSILIFALIGVEAKSQVELSVGADFVSSYVWRGQDCGPTAFQPGISISYAGFSFGAWGSTSLQGTHKEFDLALGYEINGFLIGITDYFFPAGDYFDYSTHQFEATLGYTISESVPLSFTWNTMFAGNDKDIDNTRLFSSYFELGYSIPVNNVVVDFAVGVSPWKSLYSDDFALTNISITGSKIIEVTDRFEIPAFAQVVLNPDSKDVYLVFGISF